jgi:hypothetical protein
VTLLLSDAYAKLEKQEAGSERRRGLRIRQHRPVKVLDPLASKYFGGQTQDISATGLRLELPAWTPLRMGQTLSVHVGLNRNGQTLANRGWCGSIAGALLRGALRLAWSSPA